MSKKGKPGSLFGRTRHGIVAATPGDLTRESIARIGRQAREAIGAPLLTDFALTEENFLRYAKQLGAYHLVTADIFYRLPDHPDFLQEYIWQDLDIGPSYPVLNKFLDFWRRELDGPLHSVRVGETDIFTAPQIRAGVEIRFN